MQTSTWKAVTLLLLAALLGGAIGSAATARVVGHRHGPHGGPGRNSEWYVDLLRRELNLTPTQQDSVRAILRRRRGEMDSIWATLGPPMERMRDSIRSDVRTMLTAKQQGRFAEITARLDARRRDMMNRDSTDR
jgi:Spy/CpxP family protein refolding chaperone